ncbi:hypothetical protein ISS09_02225 [Candidatus Woesearchaeota archaeon]|nr:hypothetical protein [Candidatus Woesearchaeota archaeon]
MSLVLPVLGTAMLAYTGLSIAPSLQRKYFKELVPEVGVALKSWLTDQTYKKTPDRVFASLHNHFFPLEKYGGIENFVDGLMARSDIVAVTERGNTEMATVLKFKDLQSQVQDLGQEYEVVYDNKIIKVSKGDNSVILLKSQELLTKQHLEIVTYGCTNFSDGVSADVLTTQAVMQNATSSHAHPYSLSTSMFRGRFRLPSREEEIERTKYSEMCDWIEGHNAQNSWFAKSMIGSNVLATRMASELGKPCIATADGHGPISNVSLAGISFSPGVLNTSSGNDLLYSMRQATNTGDYELHRAYNDPVNFGRTVFAAALKEFLHIK